MKPKTVKIGLVSTMFGAEAVILYMIYSLRGAKIIADIGRGDPIYLPFPETTVYIGIIVSLCITIMLSLIFWFGDRIGN